MEIKKEILINIIPTKQLFFFFAGLFFDGLIDVRKRLISEILFFYDLGLLIPLSYSTILPATDTFKLFSDLNFTKK